ncbi:hypothetical protein G5B47_04875 [Paenibacillus sp. 7124]|uniref:STAS/SEC14 domain-containing protein n=1 Tax=Paenibacillus apii TaxID=1850370 RepID=A0A6M1PEE7_9BACL|nr:hypothetical protein [Paenibacillus apii]NGM81739.1 hypothetical protein [Paenibacillus apii]
MSAYTINYDEQRNLIIVVAERLDENAAAAYIKDFEEILKKVKPGFSGITDVRKAKSVLSQEVVALLSPTMQLAINRGLRMDKKWVYLSDSPLFTMQLNRMFRNQVEYKETYEEAYTYFSS